MNPAVECDKCGSLATLGICSVAFNTFVEDLPTGMYPDRLWNVGDNPKTAVRKFPTHHPEFEVNHDVETKPLITAASGGWPQRL